MTIAPRSCRLLAPPAPFSPLPYVLLRLIGRPRLGEYLLKLIERARAHRASLTARDYETHRSIEPGYFGSIERARQLRGKAQPRHSGTILDVVLDGHPTFANLHLIRKTGEALTLPVIHQAVEVQRKVGGEEVLHAAYVAQTILIQRDELGLPQPWCPAPRATPHLA